MGGLLSKDDELQRAPEADSKPDMPSHQPSPRVFLTGISSSGKTTVLYQARVLYGDGFNEQQALDYLSTITSNILENLAKIISVMKKDQLIEEQPESFRQAADLIMLAESKQDQERLSPELGRAFEVLYSNPVFQSALVETQRSPKLSISRCTVRHLQYWKENLSTICGSDYVPRIPDILRTKRTTLGVTSLEFSGKDASFTLVDVGGTRSQRSKWLHQFPLSTALMYVCSLGHYNQRLFEGEESLCLVEAIGLFETLMNHHDLANKNVFLFFTMRDIFEDKFVNQKIPLQDTLPEYPGSEDPNVAIEFITAQFLSKNKNPQRNISVFVGNALSEEDARKVLGAVESAVSFEQD
eukprot:TRINITY_DN12727_c0_g1_i5.p1 TRINITY_DN12727_c0_g1~~TRINITY_DN12727_c0_g1_i5.p1  ORF type:complete len:364 (-),score=76.31 TRINITY_DN12727_c0_g1_i5:37-1098(-)